MKNYISILKKTKLFKDIPEDEILSMTDCIGGIVKDYKKGEYIFRHGEGVSFITILVSGKLHIQKDDYWGNRSIMNVIESGELFAEAYAISGECKILNDVVAVEDSSVVFLDAKKVLKVCPCSCRFHSLMVENLFNAITEKNRNLVRKLEHMSQRTTREKLISYLSEEAGKKNKPSFEIPFNRQQLADFLSVDRSAMSNELCKMRDDGLIKFEKNRFQLL